MVTDSPTAPSYTKAPRYTGHPVLSRFATPMNSSTPLTTRDFPITLAVVGLLGIHALLLAYSATVHGPTDLEPAFIASGLYHWEQMKFEHYRVNPPLPRMLATLPLLLTDYSMSWSGLYNSPGQRNELALGDRFLDLNGQRSLFLLHLARWANSSFSLVGGYVAYRWSRALYGTTAGILTLTLWTFEPNLLAHAELVTPDSACWSCGLVANYLFWHWLRSPTWRNALCAGFGLGLAELTKFTWILLFILWPVIWCCWQLQTYRQKTSSCNSTEATPSNRGWLSGCVHLVLIITLAINIINAGYAYQGTGITLGQYPFVSKALSKQSSSEADRGPGNRFTNTWLSDLPIPLPLDYVLGLDVQKKDLEAFGVPSFLRGTWKRDGWWYYYLYGLAVKAPVGLWGLLLYSLLVTTRPISHSFGDILLPALIALAVMTTVSMHTAFNIHLRYVYPCLALTLVVIGRATCATGNRRLRACFISMCAGGVICECASVYPHQLAFFNCLVGGPAHGAYHLRGSNLDWCQDVPAAVQCASALADRSGLPVYIDDGIGYKLRALYPECSVLVSGGAMPDHNASGAYVLRGLTLWPSEVPEGGERDEAVLQRRSDLVKSEWQPLGLSVSLPYSFRLYFKSGDDRSSTH